MEAYLREFVALADGVKLSVVVVLILANFITGIAASLYTGTFRLKALADFLYSRVLPFILSYFAVVIVAVVEPAWSAAVPVVWGVIILALAGAILANLKEMGIKLPESLAGNKSK